MNIKTERPPAFIQLKEKITLCRDFTPEERGALLDALNLGEYSGKHTYPDGADPKRTKNPFIVAAWSLLDQLAPEAMRVRDRYMLGGMIAGALSDAFDIGKSIGESVHAKKQ